MESRHQLHDQLKEICPNVYFQPPENYKLTYPCIIYTKSGLNEVYGDNIVYLRQQIYGIMVIDKNPDTKLHLDILNRFDNSRLENENVFDNLYHKSIRLYYKP